VVLGRKLDSSSASLLSSTLDYLWLPQIVRAFGRATGGGEGRLGLPVIN